METAEEIPMRMIGTMIGARAEIPLGSFPYSATSSSYVFVTSALSASSAALTFFPMKFEKKYPAASGKMEQTTPSPMTRSRLSPIPNVFAAAIGPGVGGMKTCAMYSPEPRPIDMATDEAPVLCTRALRIGFRITKPESQKTGIETTQPMSSMARTGWFLPTSLMTMSASFSAAPVCSRILPIRAPRMMTIPILENVPEKPAPMTDARPETFVPSSRV